MSQNTLKLLQIVTYSNRLEYLLVIRTNMMSYYGLLAKECYTWEMQLVSINCFSMLKDITWPQCIAN